MALHQVPSIVVTNTIVLVDRFFKISSGALKHSMELSNPIVVYEKEYPFGKIKIERFQEYHDESKVPYSFVSVFSNENYSFGVRERDFGYYPSDPNGMKVFFEHHQDAILKLFEHLAAMNKQANVGW